MHGPDVTGDGVTTLVLFDIDGTLLDTSGAGRRAFIRALKAVFGWDDEIPYISFAGATDLDVIRRIAEKQGASLSADDEDRFFRGMPQELERTIREVPGTLCPGVRELLEALTARDDVLVGLVTGNTDECAAVKLRSCDIHGHFMLGAFGHEHADRNDIARLALQRARDQVDGQQPIGPCFLVGDTPADVAAARAIGATSLAVATGSYEEHALRDAGADVVLRDLSDLAGVMGLLGC